jgi:hypothetical protein
MLARMTDPSAAQRAVLDALFKAHPRMLDINELAAQLTGVPRVREAVRVLVDDGLATQLGQLVGVSRAAVRFDALARAELATFGRTPGWSRDLAPKLRSSLIQGPGSVAAGRVERPEYAARGALINAELVARDCAGDGLGGSSSAPSTRSA